MNESTLKEYIINLEVNEYKFFPGEIIEGILNIKATDNLINKYILNDIIIYFSLTEKISYYCEQLDYTYETISHFKENKTYLIHEITNNCDYLNGYSINYGLKIPFKFPIPKIDKNNNLMPTFIFIEKNFQCYIIHQLNVEIKNKSNTFSIDIFIRKPKLVTGNNNVNIFRDEMIKKYFMFKIGKLSYYIETINSCNYSNNLPVEIHLDQTDLKNIKIKSINLSINKTIFIKDINFSYKKIIFSKNINISDNLNNKQFKENIKINCEFPEISKNIIEKQIYGNIGVNEIKSIRKYNYSPPLENLFFKCSYVLKIVLIFEAHLIQNRIVEIPIDYFDEGNNNLKGNFEGNILESCKEKEVNKNYENKLNILNDGFIVLTKEEFINLIDGKKNF